jgi:predicted RNA-binding protein with PUA domain
MGVALYLGKKIFLLNEIPEVENKEEILGMKPVIINNNLNKIN